MRPCPGRTAPHGLVRLRAALPGTAATRRPSRRCGPDRPGSRSAPRPKPPPLQTRWPSRSRSRTRLPCHLLGSSPLSIEIRRIGHSHARGSRAGSCTLYSAHLRSMVRSSSFGMSGQGSGFRENRMSYQLAQNSRRFGSSDIRRGTFSVVIVIVRQSSIMR